MTRGDRRTGAIVAVMSAVALIAVHVVVLRYATSRLRLPVVVAGGVLTLIVVWHLRIIPRLRDRLRGHSNGS